MLAVFRFLILAFVKILGMLLYSWDFSWISPAPAGAWKKIKLVVILNHTSLFEPIFSRFLPFSFLWRLARYATFPAADKTMNRPVAGRMFKMMAPNVISISRSRDSTWTNFLGSLAEESIIMILPEGRMKRPNGLDKDGKPMTVRGGIADILSVLEDGYMLIGYSGGLHHMQSPGQMFPRIFKRLKLNLEVLLITDYKDRIGHQDDSRAFKMAVVKDLEYRRDTNCPVG